MKTKIPSLTFSDDRTFPNINCGESREHRDIPEDDNTNFQHVRGGENTLISKVGVHFYANSHF